MHGRHHRKTKGVGQTLVNAGAIFTGCNLIVVLLSIGALKFTAYEAEGIQPLVSNSLLMSWGYEIASVRDFSKGL